MASKNRKSKSGNLNKLGVDKKTVENNRKIKDLDAEFEAFKEALSTDNYITRTRPAAGVGLV